MDSKVEFLFLNEEDMIKAGVLDADRAVDTIGEVITLLSEGDYLMGGRAHNDHGVQPIFPEKSDSELPACGLGGQEIHGDAGISRRKISYVR